ncbi:MAG: hypothetical protein U0L83_06050 [Muribaculaceae bacterium]|nr:hypothetical protein [Muribaculaceae bacterium]
MKKNLLYIAAAALALGSCSDENKEIIVPTPGEEVAFGVQLDAETRTVWGEEVTEGGHYFPIYWNSGDRIDVASPQADKAFQTGKYEVSAGTNQNYATKITKIGETGVRWGNSPTANFFAAYPAAEQGNSLVVSGTDVTASMTISSTQKNYITDNVVEGKSPYKAYPEMDNDIMYAKKYGAPSGTTVDLQFNPFATVVQMTLKGPETSISNAEDFYIQNVQLQAPADVNIAGSFELKFDGDTDADVTASVANGSNIINVSPVRIKDATDHTPLPNMAFKSGDKMVLTFFLIPNTDKNKPVSIGAGWRVNVQTSAGVFSRELKVEEGVNAQLLPGKVHQLPEFPPFNVDANWTFSTNSWLSTIPDNVYVSELSLPGAWYAWDGSHTGKSSIFASWDKNEGYQISTATIAALFEAGIRAFQVETRVGFTGGAQRNLNSSTVVINGTGKNATLVDYYEEATALNDMITALQTQLEKYKSEFSVLAISYSDGGSTSLGEDCKSIWINKLQAILSGYSNIVYASEITPNTTIASVKGKIIVMINVDAEVENKVTTWPNALFAYTNTSWAAETINSSLISPMKRAAWPGIGANVAIGTVGANPNNMYLNYTLANRTYSGTGTAPAGMPNLENRKAAIRSLIENSDQVYAAKTHNAWYYIGAGGTYAKQLSGDSDDNGPQNLAGGTNGLNAFLLDQIKSKVVNHKPSPLGLVFFNQCTGAKDTYYGEDIVNEIIRMNNKFYLQREEPTTQTQQIKSVIPTHSSGFRKSTNGWDAF